MEFIESFKAQGLQFLGTLKTSSFPEMTAEYEAWIRKGMHGEMEYLARHASMKYSPNLIMPQAKTIILAALPYYQKSMILETASASGKVSCYARGKDYHKVFIKKLRQIEKELKQQSPSEEFRSFTDTSPLDERFYALQSGSAMRGRNGLCYMPRLGSWFFIGLMLTSKELPEIRQNTAFHCPPDCRVCIQACPTGALKENQRLDSRLCLSYWTIEYKGLLPKQIKQSLGNHLFGCDECQNCCPLNQKIEVTKEKDFLITPGSENIPLSKILKIKDDSAFTELFAGKPLHRAGRSGLIRNALAVAVNLNSKELVPLIVELLQDPHPVIQESARAALIELA